MDLEILNQYWSLIFFALLWELVWKGIALWMAARASDKLWYVIMLIVNTLGIVPIVYILLNRNKATQPNS